MLLTEERKRVLQAFAKNLGLEIRDFAAFNRAFVHSSYANENSVAEHLNNERLEFLGDSVIGFMVTEYLYLHSPMMREGELSKLKSLIVCQKILAQRARELGLGNYLLLGRGEELSGGRYRDSILANCFEALVGAVLMTCGLEHARGFVFDQLISEIFEEEIGNKRLTDYKSTLQELAQKDLNQLPKYKVIRTQGPDHNPTFEVAVCITDHVLATGEGKSKKSAEQLAARRALKNLEKMPDDMLCLLSVESEHLHPKAS